VVRNSTHQQAQAESQKKWDLLTRLFIPFIPQHPFMFLSREKILMDEPPKWNSVGLLPTKNPWVCLFEGASSVRFFCDLDLNQHGFVNICLLFLFNLAPGLP
jgi:hypothetical protein